MAPRIRGSRASPAATRVHHCAVSRTSRADDRPSWPLCREHCDPILTNKLQGRRSAVPPVCAARAHRHRLRSAVDPTRMAELPRVCIAAGGNRRETARNRVGAMQEVGCSWQQQLLARDHAGYPARRLRGGAAHHKQLQKH
jgi:hypothetical protein